MEKKSTLDVIKDKWLEKFTGFNQANAKVTAINPSVSQKAMQQFDNQGFPSTKNEEWKYTSVLSLLKKEFHHAFFPPKLLPELAEIEQFFIPGFEGSRIVLINGFFAPTLSSIKEEDDKIVIGAYSGLNSENRKIVAHHITKCADTEKNAFVALNTAFSTDSAVVFVPKNKQLNQPVHLIQITDARKENVSAHTRAIVILEEHSEAKIISSSFTLGENESFVNAVTEVFANRNSHADIYFQQNDTRKSHYIGATQIVQHRDSQVNTVTITTGGKMVRNDLNFIQKDEHCDSNMYGLYFTDADMHVDNHSLMDHAKANCTSNELYKGVLSGDSTAVFNGKIIVRQDSQKINAFQSNKNILLSDNATVNTKPQLEIFADDVKCSHGATIGKLNDEALFYMLSRGISRKKAEYLMTLAFASDVLENVKIDALRNHFEDLISKKMSQL